jgi:hypothetical protein
VTDWLNSVPPEWLLVGWCGLMFIALGTLLIVMAWATSPERYRGTRRQGRPTGAGPYEARPHHGPRGVVSYEAGLRVGGWVPAGQGRHARPEEVPPLPWAPPRRDTAGA